MKILELIFSYLFGMFEFELQPNSKKIVSVVYGLVEILSTIMNFGAATFSATTLNITPQGCYMTLSTTVLSTIIVIIVIVTFIVRDA